MKSINNIQIILAFAFLFIGCENTERNNALVNQMIDEEVKNRVQKFEERLSKECYDGIAAEANLLADSILLAEARAMLDTISKPPRPDRPDAPSAKILQNRAKILVDQTRCLSMYTVWIQIQCCWCLISTASTSISGKIYNC